MLRTVDQLRAGESGVVCGFMGGRGVMQRLESLGLRAGKKVTKLSSQFMAGPVTLLVDGRQVALGRGIASRVQVQAGPPG